MLATVPLLIIDDLGVRKVPLIAAEELPEIIMRQERASTLMKSNRPVEDLGNCWRREGQVSTSQTSRAITILLSFDNHLNCVWRNCHFDRQYCSSVWLEWRRNCNFSA